MTRLLLVAAVVMLTCAAVIGTASAADVYVNETGWWHDDAAVMFISCLTLCITVVNSANNTSSNRSEGFNAIMTIITELRICRRLKNEED